LLTGEGEGEAAGEGDILLGRSQWRHHFDDRFDFGGTVAFEGEGEAGEDGEEREGQPGATLDPAACFAELEPAAGGLEWLSR
jgi:hypothetical protein